MSALFPYQATGRDWLAGRRRALLADEMGLGKTAQAITAMDRTGVDRAVIVCPASLRANWAREIETWSMGLWDAEILSYDAVVRRGLPAAPAYIFDEAHYLKSNTAKRTKACLGPAAAGADIVWGLTGTPAPNHLGEMWTWLSFFGATARSYQSFIRHHCYTRETTYGLQVMGNRKDRLPELKTTLDGLMLRRRKDDVLPDLPDIRWGDISLASNVAFEGDTSGYIVVDELPPEDEHIARMRREIGAAKAGPLGQVLAEELEQTDEKIVVFAWHREVLNTLSNALSSYGVARIDGATPAHARQREVDEFQRDPSCRVFIGQIQAAGTGITLTAASNLVFAEMSWTPGDNAQAAMRVHRIGQTRPVLIRTATLRGSLDEAVNAVLARKTRNLDQLYRREAA